MTSPTGTSGGPTAKPTVLASPECTTPVGRKVAFACASVRDNAWPRTWPVVNPRPSTAATTNCPPCCWASTTVRGPPARECAWDWNSDGEPCERFTTVARESTEEPRLPMIDDARMAPWSVSFCRSAFSCCSELCLVRRKATMLTARTTAMALRDSGDARSTLPAIRPPPRPRTTAVTGGSAAASLPHETRVVNRSTLFLRPKRFERRQPVLTQRHRPAPVSGPDAPSRLPWPSSTLRAQALPGTARAGTRS